jgi:hypothetical protein
VDWSTVNNVTLPCAFCADFHDDIKHAPAQPIKYVSAVRNLDASTIDVAGRQLRITKGETTGAIDAPESGSFLINLDFRGTARQGQATGTVRLVLRGPSWIRREFSHLTLEHGSHLPVS